jgi:hypothetical protein
MGELDRWIDDWKSGADERVRERLLTRAKRDALGNRAAMAAMVLILASVLAVLIRWAVQTPRPTVIVVVGGMGVFAGVFLTRVWGELSGLFHVPSGGARAHVDFLKRKLDASDRILAFAQKAIWSIPVGYAVLIVGVVVEARLIGRPLPIRNLILNMGMFATIQLSVLVSYRWFRRRIAAQRERLVELERLQDGEGESG